MLVVWNAHDIEAFDDHFAEALYSNPEDRQSYVIDVTLFREFSEGWAIVTRETYDLSAQGFQPIGEPC